MEEALKSIKGSLVEDNTFSVSVHYRMVAEGEDRETVERVVDELIGEMPMLRKTHGKMVYELRPSADWNKGKAVEYLAEQIREELGDDVFPIYIGDDVTDEDAFAVMADLGGIGIIVSESLETVTADATAASYALRSPTEVVTFLRHFADRGRPALTGPPALTSPMEGLLRLGPALDFCPRRRRRRPVVGARHARRRRAAARHHRAARVGAGGGGGAGRRGRWRWRATRGRSRPIFDAFVRLTGYTTYTGDYVVDTSLVVVEQKGERAAHDRRVVGEVAALLRDERDVGALRHGVEVAGGLLVAVGRIQV